MSDQDFSITLNAYFNVKWRDPRLLVSTEAEAGQTASTHQARPTQLVVKLRILEQLSSLTGLACCVEVSSLIFLTLELLNSKGEKNDTHQPPYSAQPLAAGCRDPRSEGLRDSQRPLQVGR